MLPPMTVQIFASVPSTTSLCVFKPVFLVVVAICPLGVLICCKLVKSIANLLVYCGSTCGMEVYIYGRLSVPLRRETRWCCEYIADN